MTLDYNSYFAHGNSLEGFFSSCHVHKKRLITLAQPTPTFNSVNGQLLRATSNSVYSGEFLFPLSVRRQWESSVSLNNLTFNSSEVEISVRAL